MDIIRKAIDNINKLLTFIKDDKITGIEFVMDDCNWLEAAKSALEKQIPLKPQEKKCDFSDFTIVCPKCGSVIINTFNNTKYQPHYCRDCGKALDRSNWSN